MALSGAQITAARNISPFQSYAAFVAKAAGLISIPPITELMIVAFPDPVMAIDIDREDMIVALPDPTMKVES